MNTRYEILNQLGEGGEGSVWKAWDTRLQRFVAIKKLLPLSQREVPDAGDIFAEASALSALQHPNIVSVYDVENDPEDGPYVVMEFLNGENLEQTVQRGGLTPEDFISITNQALEGIVAAHKLGMQHRDIKPANIMLTWLPDQRFVAKLLDFGLAKFTTRPKQQTVKGNNKILGSIYFMAPEQFSHRPLDHRSDLYSLGCVLYYSLTTRYPFAGDTPAQVMQSHLDHMVAALRDVRPDVPSILCDWVMWLIRRQPEQRPRDAGQAMEVFRGLVSGEITELPQAATGLRTTTVMGTRQVPATVQDVSDTIKTVAVKAKKSPTLLYAGLGITALLGLGAFFLFSKGNSTPTVAAEDPAPARPTTVTLPDIQLPPAPPVTVGLNIWLEAEAGVKTVNGVVQTWQDLEPNLGGATDFVPPPEASGPKSQAPTVVDVNDKYGLVGRHKAISFKGLQSLHGQQRDGAPKLAGGLVEMQFSLFVVFRVPSADKSIHRLVSAKCGNETKAWDLCIDRNKFSGGIRFLDGTANKTELEANYNEDFFIGELGRDGEKNYAKAYLVDSNGTEISSKVPIVANMNHGPLKVLRLAALSEFSNPSEANYLTGDIASALLYSRNLSHGDRLAVTSYLKQRFFGK